MNYCYLQQLFIVHYLDIDNSIFTLNSMNNKSLTVLITKFHISTVYSCQRLTTLSLTTVKCIKLHIYAMESHI